MGGGGWGSQNRALLQESECAQLWEEPRRAHEALEAGFWRISSHQAIYQRRQARPATERTSRGSWGKASVQLRSSPSETNPRNLVVSLSLQVGLRAKSQKETLDAEESKEPIRPVLPSILHLTANKTLESNGSPDPCMFLFGPTLTRKQAGKGMLGNVVLSLTEATEHSPPGSLN